MPIDAGVNWGGSASAASGAYIEVSAASNPAVGVIRVEIAQSDTPVLLAARTETEWNARAPIAGVTAAAIAGTGYTRFLHPGGQIVGMAVTFDGKPRMPLGVGDQVSSQGNDVTIKRVMVDPDNPAGAM